MTLDFYYIPSSPPCRAVLLTAKALNIELNLKKIDLMKGEHKSEEYLKINPQHTVPTLVDDGLALSESRAIMAYLVSQYGKDDSLYPKEPRKRAIVDQRLYFDASTLYSRYADYYYTHYFTGAPFDVFKYEKLKDSLTVLNAFLENSTYAASEQLTIADFSLVASVSSIEASGFDISTYKNVGKWFEKVKLNATGYEEANGKNVEIFKKWVESFGTK